MCGLGSYGCRMSLLWLPPIAGVLLEFVARTGGTLVLASGFIAGTMRALAVLGGFAAERVEWTTAAGFVGGAAFGALVLVADLVIG